MGLRDSILTSLLRAESIMRGFCSKASRLLQSCVIAIPFALTILLIAFLAADVAIKSDQDVPGLAAYVTHQALKLLGVGNLEGDGYALAVASTRPVLMAVIPFWFIWLRWRTLSKHKRELQDAAVVDESPVTKVGRDDLDTMLKYYSRATKITVFSGDFDWILRDTDLRRVILRLARKNDALLLVSHSSPERIEKEWEELGNEKHLEWKPVLEELKPFFRFHTKQLKFTLLEIGDGQESFLALVRGFPGIDEDTNIGVHSAKNNKARSLVHVVRKLCDLVDCRNSYPTWEQAEPNSSA